MPLPRALACALVVASLRALPSRAQTVLLPTGFLDETLARGAMNRPAAMAFLPDGRMLIAETASGKVRELVRDTLVAAPVAVIDSGRYGDWEQGLLGVALDPRFPAAPYIYVYYTFSGAPTMRLMRYRLQGRYVCADGFQRWTRMLGARGDGSWGTVPREPGQPDSVNWAMVTNLPWLMSSVDVGPDGAIYYLLLFTDFLNPSGELRRIRYAGPTSAVAPPRTATALHARHLSRGRWEFTITAPARDAVLSIVDVRGRTVRRWSVGGTASPWRLRWEDGALSAGVYFAARTTNTTDGVTTRTVRLAR